MNSVNPEASIAWYKQYWPKGQATTFAGFPAFHDDIYLLYTKVAKQAPGAFDRTAERSVPQSPFWTLRVDLCRPNTNAARAPIRETRSQAVCLRADLRRRRRQAQALHALELPMAYALLTKTAMAERPRKKSKPAAPPPSALDFFYFVDPDGMLVEVTAGKTDSFWNHSTCGTSVRCAPPTDTPTTSASASQQPQQSRIRV